MLRLMIALSLLTVAACAGAEPVHLWNPKTDQIVKCGPFGDQERNPEGEKARLAACIDHYERLGFIHAPVH